MCLYFKGYYYFDDKLCQCSFWIELVKNRNIQADHRIIDSVGDVSF